MTERLKFEQPEVGRRADLVLVADDQVEHRIYLCHILARQGASVRMAVDGVEAVTMAEQVSFDLILMDVSMPRMDGVQAVRAIREIERASGHPRAFIQMTTSHGEEEDHAWSEEAGADGHLVKPISVRTVLAVLDQARGRKAATDDRIIGAA